jgi:hypothetical protein
MKREFDWDMPVETRTSNRYHYGRRSKVLVAIILAIAGPFAAWEIRGLCWEALVGSIVIFAIGLAVLRLPFSVWLAALLVVGACGSAGLIGWSGWRFHSQNIFSSYSPRLTICGRDYQPEGPTQRHLPVPFKSLTQHVIGVTPSGSAILGADCQTTVLYIESPGPMYRPYDLLGGP